MSIVFVDTLYLVALYNPKDQWHERAVAAGSSLAATNLITTEDVLVELLNFFSQHGDKARRGATAQVEGIFSDAEIEVIPQHHDRFIAALALYKARPDKGYSLTDCISMNVKRERNISNVLTHDDHFTQEGFKVLL